MGYYVSQVAGRFFLHRFYFDLALQALKAYPQAHPDTLSGGLWDDGKPTQKWWAWVNMDDLAATRTLHDALYECRWDTQTDEEGNLNNLIFCGEKAGDEQYALSAIAPWVATGSYVQMRGEEGEEWRWVFAGGELREVGSNVVWEQDLPDFRPEASDLEAAIRVKQAAQIKQTTPKRRRRRTA